MSDFEYENTRGKDFVNGMKDHNLVDQSLTDQPKDLDLLINVECQRIFEAKDMIQNQEKDLRLFAASISLARLFQAQYHFCDNRSVKHISLSNAESEEVDVAVVNILDPILRIIAWNMILDLKDPLIFDEEQRDKLIWEMITLLQDLIPRLPLLISTFLLVRCYTARLIFPVPFQHMADVIGKKLNETPIDKRSQEYEAAFIALQQLNDSALSHYLSEFVKRTINLSDLLQFNSSIFFQYFTKTTSFNESDTTFLSLIYLTELIFDAEILQMNTGGCHRKETPP